MFIVAIACCRTASWSLSGLGTKDFANHGAIAKLIAVAAPEHSGALDRLGFGAYFQILEFLDDRLLVEIRKMLEGLDSDKANLAIAAEILRISNEIMLTTP